ncbi:MAG: substrate-binding domain-containing protein [Candidatus Choladocola sp.]|nr:substrate-binding domain-containing protein [Candidatus Choladocola sp.]
MKRSKKIIGLLATGMLVCAMAGSVSYAEEAKTAPEGLEKIGVTFMKTDPFMVPLYNGMKDYCDELGIELIAYYADNDIETQINQADDLIQQGIQALIVMPVDAEGITPALDAAAAADIPVVSVDAACAEAEKTIAYIASNNYAAGYECGKHVTETLDSAKIIALTHPEILCTIERYQGFCDAIEEGGDAYEIIAEQPCKGLMAEAMNAMDNLIQAHDDFNVVFCINDGSSQGAISSLEAANRLEGVQVYGIDGQQTNADLIKEGKLTGESAQQPYEMGKGAVDLIVKHFAGEAYEYENLLDITFLTAENVEGYEGF